MRRATVYHHFPDERALILGCSGAWRGAQSATRPGDVDRAGRPAARLEAALEALYRWYEEVEPMLSAVLRDIEAMPIIAEIQAGRLRTSLTSRTASRRAGEPEADARLRATIGLALDFFAWRTLESAASAATTRSR